MLIELLTIEHAYKVTMVPVDYMQNVISVK